MVKEWRVATDLEHLQTTDTFWSNLRALLPLEMRDIDLSGDGH